MCLADGLEVKEQGSVNDGDWGERESRGVLLHEADGETVLPVSLLAFKVFRGRLSKTTTLYPCVDACSVRFERLPKPMSMARYTREAILE